MRQSDQKYRKYLRSKRFYQNNQQWYFKTREGLNCGPFDCKQQSAGQLKKFIGFQHAISSAN